MKTNEEKAKELAENNGRYYYVYQKCGGDTVEEFSYDECYQTALEMAEWKDKKLKENERTTSKLNEEELQKVVLEAIDKTKHTNGIDGAARFASMNYSVYEVAMEVAKVMNEKLSKE